MVQDIKFKEALSLHPDYSSRFSYHLLRTLIDMTEDDSNIAISPARLQAVMVLLANWASPIIQRGILERVGNDVITQDEANILSSIKLLTITPNDWYKNEEGDFVPTIEQQTILWAQKELTVNKDALAMMDDDFSILLKQVDFASSSLKSEIDNTISEATHGLINKLDIEIPQEALALITDILYFKGAWMDEFGDYNTKEQLFYGTKGKTKVPMMKLTADMQYAEMSRCKMVRLPYFCMSNERTSYAMRIYLPKPKESLSDVLRELWDSEFNFHTERQEVKLTLPRFSTQSSINMHELFEQLDLAYIFEIEDIIPKCINGLQIADIVQQTKISVDENGTEAAVVTSVAMCTGCPPDEKPKPIVMTVNRPFIFEIAEESTNTILFTGVINNIEVD